MTGGQGLIGSRLVDHLLRKVYAILIGSRRKISQDECAPGAKYITVDGSDEDSLLKCCRDVDVVVHTAGMNAQDCVKDPPTALQVNGLHTARLAKSASRSRVRRFIYISTAHVYSDPLMGVINVNTRPQNPHPYATSHLAGEKAILELNQNGCIEGIAVRLSNAFGRPLNKYANCWGLLVNELCRDAVINGKLTIKSNGLGLRDYVPLSDVCELLEDLIINGIKAEKGGVINMGSGRTMTTLDMAIRVQRRYQQMFGMNLKIITNECDTQSIAKYLKYICLHLGGTEKEYYLRVDKEIDDLLNASVNWFCPEKMST